MNYIKLLTDFTETPGGRYISDGPFSGELFRETILYPKLKKTLEEGGILIVDIDGTYGLCPGFLDEAFGGLVRIKKLDPILILKSIQIISNEEESYIHDIQKYIERK